MVEIFAEAAGFDFGGEFAVGGGEDASVEFDGLATADTLELALLENAEKLGLELGGEFADFVEEDGAAGGHFEFAGLAVDGSGKGTFFVAEEFAFEEAFAEDGAVEGEEGAFGTIAGAMDGLGDDLFAGTAFAEDEDGGFGGGGAKGEVKDAEPVGALADDAGEALAEHGVFGFEGVEMELAFEGDGGEGGEGTEGIVVRAGAGVVEAKGSDALAAGEDGNGGDAFAAVDGDLFEARAEGEADGGAAQELGEMLLDDGVGAGEEGAEEENHCAGFEEGRGTASGIEFVDEAMGADGDVVAGVEVVFADAETVDEGAFGGTEIGEAGADEDAVTPGDTVAFEDDAGVGVAADDGFDFREGDGLAGEGSVEREKAGGHGEISLSGLTNGLAEFAGWLIFGNRLYKNQSFSRRSVACSREGTVQTDHREKEKRQ